MSIPELDFGVYDSWYEKIVEYCDKLAAAAPELVKKSFLGKSRQGRDLVMLTITDFATGRPEDKPAVLQFANMHCHELSGPIAALRCAKGLLEERPEALKNTTFYIIPRINPDNVEDIIRRSGFTRSRWEYSHKMNTFHHCDVDGNGYAACMRVECPWGDQVQDPENPQRMIKRKSDSKPPFYLVMGEGEVEKWDGMLMPHDEGEGLYYDWNRTSPYGWKPNGYGQGPFPFFEPEMYSLATFVAEHRNIYAIINYHNGWGALLEPKQMQDADRKYMDDVLKIASEKIGYPIAHDGTLDLKCNVSAASKEFTGQFDDMAYHGWGLFAITIELGTFENSSGWSTTDIISHHDWNDFNPIEAVLEYQEKNHPAREAFQKWTPCIHPQYGKVEVGGFDCVGLASPSSEFLKKVCDGVLEFVKDLAQKKPQLKVVNEEKLEIKPGVTRLRLIVQNCGDLPTHVMNTGKNVTWRFAPYIELETCDNAQCVSRISGYRTAHFGSFESRVFEWFILHDGKASATVHIEGGAAGTFDYPVQLG